MKSLIWLKTALGLIENFLVRVQPFVKKVLIGVLVLLAFNFGRLYQSNQDSEVWWGRVFDAQELAQDAIRQRDSLALGLYRSATPVIDTTLTVISDWRMLIGWGEYGVDSGIWHTIVDTSCWTDTNWLLAPKIGDDEI